MIKKYISNAIIPITILLLFASCSFVKSGVSGLVERLPQKESLQEKALSYMTESYGDIFESGRPGSRGSSQQIESTVYLKVVEHPYDYIEVISPWYDDGMGETLFTDYPHYLFGNEAGPKWKEMLSTVFPEMGYLPPAWQFITKEEDESGAYSNISGSWAKSLGGLTKDSTVEEYMEATPIYGMLVLPENGYIPDDIESKKEFFEGNKFLTELNSIDSKYDFFLYVILLRDDFFEELSFTGDPAEQLFAQYGNSPDGVDPLEYARRKPHISIDYGFDSMNARDNITVIIRYFRTDGKVTRIVDYLNKLNY